VPLEYVRDGEIILNVSADATRDLTIGNEAIQFSARFNGVSRELSVPVDCVSGVFAKETGQGLAFQQPASTAGAVPTALAPVESITDRDDKPTPPTGGKPRLQVVK
jgi:stringent starvation protein B